MYVLQWFSDQDYPLSVGTADNRGHTGNTNEMADNRNCSAVDLGTNFVPIDMKAGGHQRHQVCARSPRTQLKELKCWGLFLHHTLRMKNHLVKDLKMNELESRTRREPGIDEIVNALCGFRQMDFPQSPVSLTPITSHYFKMHHVHHTLPRR